MSLLCLFGSQLCKNLEVPGFTESVAQTSVKFVLQISLTCHRGMVLLLPRSIGLRYMSSFADSGAHPSYSYAVPLCVPCTGRAGLYYTCS